MGARFGITDETDRMDAVACPLGRRQDRPHAPPLVDLLRHEDQRGGSLPTVRGAVHMNRERWITHEPPIETLSEELDARGLSLSDIAALVPCGEQDLREQLDGTKRLTLNTSMRLGQIFGVSVAFWARMDKGYWRSRCGGRCG